MPSFPSKNEVLEIVLKRITKSKPTWILFLPTTKLKIVELEYYLSAKHCKKMKISIKNLFSKLLRICTGLVTFTKESLDGKLQLLCNSTTRKCKRLQILLSFLQSWTPPPRPSPPFFLREPSPFWVPLFFWSRLKKLPHSFWEPSKLLDANCINQFKMKVLRFVLLH